MTWLPPAPGFNWYRAQIPMLCSDPRRYLSEMPLNADREAYKCTASVSSAGDELGAIDSFKYTANELADVSRKLIDTNHLASRTNSSSQLE